MVVYVLCIMLMRILNLLSRDKLDNCMPQVLGTLLLICISNHRFSGFSVHPVAKPARQFSHAMQILNHYHYLFLQKLIVFTVCKHENICIV